MTDEKKLPELPDSSDKDFWQGEIEIIEMHDKQRCLHGGNLVSRDNSAFCVNCGAGWLINGQDKIIDGHLYHLDKKII